MEIPAQERELVETNIEGYLKQHEEKDLLRFLTAGSVDDGKSTLIGRLLYDSKLVYEDQLAAVERDSERRGSTGGETDLALLMDGLKAEREQGITIDVAYRFFSTARRKFIIADTPGHEQYTRNMATGASTADLAVILVDARQGVLAQTKRHSFIASLLGIRHVVVAINKMDLVDYDEATFQRIKADYANFASRLEIPDIHFIPLSALKGDNVVNRSENMPWFSGSPLLDHLESVHIASDRNMIDFRFPVQLVSRPDLHFRGFQGTIASGLVRVGDPLIALPSGRTSTVQRIVTFEGDLDEAFAGQAVTLVLADEIDISRGDMLVRPNNTPRTERVFEAMVVWMHDTPATEGRRYQIKSGAQLLTAELSELRYRFDVNNLHKEAPTQDAGHTVLGLNEIGRAVFETTRPLLFDAYKTNKSTGSFIIVDRVTHVTVGAGMILERRSSDLARSGRQRMQERLAELVEQQGRIAAEERSGRYGQRPGTIWITGLPRSGKSTISYALERRLWDLGGFVHVLDGVNMRLHISRDLGFTADERSEASRRAAETARLFNDAGLITIAGFASPYAADREAAREVLDEGRFLEVWLKAPLEICKARDAALHPEGDGLYARGERGELRNVTGVSAPYEEPRSADLVIETDQLSVDDAVDRIVALLQQRGWLNN